MKEQTGKIYINKRKYIEYVELKNDTAQEQEKRVARKVCCK